MAIKSGKTTKNNDVVIADGANDILESGNGDDVVDGGAGNDYIDGGNGQDLLLGNLGNDILGGGNGNDRIYGGGGNDLIGFALGGENGNDLIYGDGHDTFRTVSGNIVLGSLNASGQFVAGATTLTAGSDIIYGGNGDETIYGDNGNNASVGGNDIVFGGGGNDRMLGEGGADTLHGGAGADTITGGSGADQFVYVATAASSDSNAAAMDRITDFQPGQDKIDLRALLGGYNLLTGTDSSLLAWGGTTSTAKGVWYQQSGGNTFVYADVDGNTATRELAVRLDGTHNLQATDFLGVSVVNTNHAPVAQNDKTMTVLEDTANTSLAIAAPTDSDGDVLTITVTGVPGGGIGSVYRADGITTVTSGQTLTSAELGGLVFRPAPNANGAAGVFSYSVSDGHGGTDTQTVTLNVTPVNDAPAGADKTISVNEDVAYALAAGDFGFADAGDTPANALLSVKIASLATDGILKYNGSAITQGQVDSGFFVARADIDAGKLTFVSSANESGGNYAQFTFSVRDNGGTLNAGVDLDPTPNTITFDVNAIADAPTLPVVAPASGDPDTESTPSAGIPLLITTALTDVDGSEDLTITITGVPAGATLTRGVEGDGVWTLSAADLDGLALIPPFGSSDDFDLTVTATSTENANDDAASSASVTLHVTINDPLVGNVIDGYIVGATVFADEGPTPNGILDPGEAWTITGPNGSFSLVGGSGPLVMFGGTDMSTGLSFEGVMKAPEGSTVVTPLTTLVAALVAGGTDVATATGQVSDAFGLAPGVDLTTFDPVQAALDGDTNAIAIYAAGVQVQNTIVMAASLLDGAAGTGLDAAAAAVVAALAATIDNATGQVDLSDAGVAQTLLSDSATQAGAAADAEVIATIFDAGTVIAASNAVVDQAVASGGTLTEVLTDVAQAAQVAQDGAAESLAAAGAAGNASTTVADFTGTNLTDQVAVAVVGAVGGTVFGTSGNNTYTGSAGADAYDGLAGDDTIDGLGGGDYLFGGDGTDILNGGDGDDQLFGNAGADTFSGGDGADLIDGGSRPLGEFASPNLVTYQYAGAGVTLDLGAGTASIAGDADDVDTLLNIQAVIGTGFADTLTGGFNAADPTERFEGLAGNDTINGGGGFIDEVSYQNSPASVFVNLAGGVANDGYGNTDFLSNIEFARGSAFDDILNGDGNNNRFRGLAGADTLNGAGGTDEADYRNSPNGVIVNLSGINNAVANLGFGSVTVLPMKATDGYGGIGFTDSLTSIENVRGSDFGDFINGNTLVNVFVGRGGADTMNAGDADDTLQGDGGNDVLNGGAGNDMLNGGENPSGQAPDFDRITYLNTGGAAYVIVNFGTVAVTVDPGTGAVTVAGGTARDSLGFIDTLIDVESVRGTTGNDILIGGNPSNATTNTSEAFEGRGGNDYIDGGSGADRIEYNNIAVGTGIRVNLGTVAVDHGGVIAAGTAQDGEGGVDTLLNVERIRGSINGDVMYGRDATLGTVDNPGPVNALEWYEGRQGADYMDGRGGNDRLDYSTSLVGVVVNLDTVAHTTPGLVMIDPGKALDGWDADLVAPGVQASTDTFFNMEQVRGSESIDYLYGSNNPADTTEQFEGQGGADSIDGGGGFDVAGYSSAGGPVVVNISAAFAGGIAAGTSSDGDTLIGIEAIRGSNLFNDWLIGGNPLNDALEMFDGRGGSDTLDGGSGHDRADYNSDPSGISADLGAGVVNDGWGGIDQLISIEEIRGSQLNDTIVGSANADILRGNRGNDAVTGGGGNDTITGGFGADTLEGGAGADTLTGNTEADTFVYRDTSEGGDVVTDFTLGAGGDAIDLRDVLVGYVEGTSNAASFVQLSESSGNTTVSVDADGVGGVFVTLVTLQGVTGAVLNDMLAQDNLMLA